MADLPPEQISDYAAEDADVALQLYRKLLPEVVAAGGRRALEECEEPLVEVLADMEEEGIRIAPVVLHEYSRELEQELKKLEEQIGKFADVSAPPTRRRHAGRELALTWMPRATFNLASPKQMGELLFDRLQLDPEPSAPRPGSTPRTRTRCRNLPAASDHRPDPRPSRLQQAQVHLRGQAP